MDYQNLVAIENAHYNALTFMLIASMFMNIIYLVLFMSKLEAIEKEIKEKD